MPTRDWETMARDYLAQRQVSAKTRETYGYSIFGFLTWCTDHQIDLRDVSPGDIAAYERDMGRAKPATKQQRLRNVRLFLDHLVQLGHIRENPAQTFGRQSPDRGTRPVLTLEQLVEMWKASTDLQDRTIFGLLAICGLRPAELVAAHVDQLTLQNGVLVLELPDRTGPHEFNYIALPPIVAADLRELNGDRRSGPLLPGRRGRTETTDKAVRLAVERLVSAVELPFKVVPLTLSYTLRAIAIEEGFSYTSVVRSVSESEPRRLAAWVKRIDSPLQAHASYQLGQLVSQPEQPEGRTFDQSERLLYERFFEPAAGLVLAAASLERFLREMLNKYEHVNEDKFGLKFFAEKLRSKQLITNLDRDTIMWIGDLRNYAAHGWFERFSLVDARRVLTQSRELVARLRS